MRSIDNLLNEYGKSHQHKINKLIHWVMVPVIFFSIVGLVMSIPVPSENIDIIYNPATVVLGVVLIYYFKLSKSLFFGFIIWAFICLYGNYEIYKMVDYCNGKLAKVSSVIFGVAWAFQFIGHKIEGAKPSFLDDIKFLLIGPAWLMHFIYKKIGFKY